MTSPKRLLVYDNMGIVGARTGDARQSCVGVRNRWQRTAAHSIERLAGALKRGNPYVTTDLVEQRLGIVQLGEGAELDIETGHGRHGNPRHLPGRLIVGEHL